jgi:hypothetical protein
MLTMKVRSNLLAATVTACAYGAIAIVAGCSSSNTGGAGGAGGTGGGNSATGGRSGTGGVVADAGTDTSTGSGGRGVADAGPPPACDGGATSCTPGGCPAPAAGKVCCLHKYNDNSVQGTSTTSDGCQGGLNAIVECQNNLGDVRGCPQENICCGVLPEFPGGLTGSRCIPAPLSAPSNFCGTNPYICGPSADGGQLNATAQCVPGAGTAPAYICPGAPGTPVGALGACVEADAGTGG